MERHSAGRGVAPGSFYSYDTQVPLIFYGAAFRGRIFEAPVSPAEVAPTLAAALGVPAPSSSTGRPLAEAFQDR
jgi:arylsulfatase A-like enzyme